MKLHELSEGAKFTIFNVGILGLNHTVYELIKLDGMYAQCKEVGHKESKLFVAWTDVVPA